RVDEPGLAEVGHLAAAGALLEVLRDEGVGGQGALRAGGAGGRGQGEGEEGEADGHTARERDARKRDLRLRHDRAVLWVRSDGRSIRCRTGAAPSPSPRTRQARPVVCRRPRGLRATSLPESAAQAPAATGSPRPNTRPCQLRPAARSTPPARSAPTVVGVRSRTGVPALTMPSRTSRRKSGRGTAWRAPSSSR